MENRSLSDMTPLERELLEALGWTAQSHPNKCGGKLLVAGERFSVAQLLAEIADHRESVVSVCNQYDLDAGNAVELLHRLAAWIGTLHNTEARPEPQGETDTKGGEP